MRLKTAIDVTRWRLCVGCGACFSVCPENTIRLVDMEDDGIRPVWSDSGQNGDEQPCEHCRICLDVCPGIHVVAPDHQPVNNKAYKSDLKRWGAFSQVWEGYASDPEIRLKGSSGGLCTALSLFCLEQKIAGGVVHIGSNPETPWKNKTYRSTSREELINRTGSRYSPASPCDGLRLMEKAPDQSVFIGKPCDVAGLRLAHDINPQLAQKTALSIGFFCAGTPSTQGTLELLKSHRIDPNSITDFRYRGIGWPGLATAHFKDQAKPPLKLTYQESWGFVNRYRPFRCYLCPDLTAESADISVGDPWYRKIGEHEPGRSLILIRTEQGREIFHQAIKQGYVTAEQCDPDIILRSQKNLLGKRQAIWGRLLAMKLLGIPRPKIKGYHLFENWMDLSGKEKVRSVLGTLRRIVQRGYYRKKQ